MPINRPSDIAGYGLHYRAFHGVTAALDSSGHLRVSQMNDAGPGADNATQATVANRPRLRQDHVNGIDAIDLDRGATQRFFTISGVPTYSNITVFAVVKPRSSDVIASSVESCPMTLLADTGVRLWSFGLSGVRALYMHNDGAWQSRLAVATAALFDGDVHTLALTVGPAGVGNTKMYVDGALVYSFTTTPPASVDIERLGVGTGDTQDGWDGLFCEAVTYTSALAATQIADLHEYATKLWKTSTPPAITSSTPAALSGDNAPDEDITFTLAAVGTELDNASIVVRIDGAVAYTGGAFQAGYAGANTLNADLSRTFAITTRPASVDRVVSVAVDATDIAGRRSLLSYTFRVQLGDITGLVAKSFPEGRRVDLTWTNPVGVTRIRIRRSAFSHPRFTDDPGDNVYDGAPIEAFVDGVYTGALATSNVALSPDTLYHYTVFYSFSTAPYVWLRTDACEVTGLSLEAYEAQFYRHVYSREMRQADGAATRGTSRYLLQKFADMPQAWVNVMRGMCKLLMRLRDPEEGPAGRVGESKNQRGILKAHAWEFGIPVDDSYDVALLRRIVMGIYPVLQQKGSKDGLVALAKLYTGWDSRADQDVDPRGGVIRYQSLHDTEAVRLSHTATVLAQDADVSVTGEVTLRTARLFTATGALAGAYDVEEPPEFVMDALGTYAAVSSADAASLGNQRLVFTNAAAKLRKELVLTLSAASGSTVEISVAAGSYPWQYPSPAAAPVFGWNAFAGLKLMDSAGTTRTVVSSEPTAYSGTTKLTLSGAVVNGAGSVAYAYDPAGATYAGRIPLTRLYLYRGGVSLTPHTLWDARLLTQNLGGPWSPRTGMGSTLAPYEAPSPVEAALWVQNAHLDKGQATSVGALSLTDTSKAWTVNAYQGSYLLPHWGQHRLFRIAHNSADTLVVEPTDGLRVTSVAMAGAPYVVLDRRNALRYLQLSRVLSLFCPDGERCVVKFE